MSGKLDLSAPWESYACKLMALVHEDDGVVVRKHFDDDEKTIEVAAPSIDQARALARLLPKEIDFGGVKVTVKVTEPDVDKYSLAQLADAAFCGNRIYRRAMETGTEGRAGFTYGILAPTVAQYWNDNISNPNGLETVTYETLAQEVFAGGEGEAVFWTSDEL